MCPDLTCTLCTSHTLRGFVVPEDMQEWLASFEPYAFWALVVLVFTGIEDIFFSKESSYGEGGPTTVIIFLFGAPFRRKKPPLYILFQNSRFSTVHADAHH